MKNSSWALLPLLLFACAAHSPLAPKGPPALPTACRSQCVTPFGERLGASAQGVEAYSNCRPDCVYQNESRAEGRFAGLQWQCVEYGRRWLMKVRGLTFPSIDYASDLWKLDSFLRMDTGEKAPVTTVVNGSAGLPHPGDILVYSREYLGTGHLAVVLEVDEKKKLLRVGEENFQNQPWGGAFARSIPIVREQGKVWILDSYLLGWKALP